MLHSIFKFRCEDNLFAKMMYVQIPLYPLTIVSTYLVDWDTNEPAGGSSENCLVLGYDGKLKSAPCQLFLSFNAAACEIKMITSTQAPVTQCVTEEMGKFCIAFVEHICRIT